MTTEAHGVTGRMAIRKSMEAVPKMQNCESLPFVSLLFCPAVVLFLIKFNTVPFFSARATIRAPLFTVSSPSGVAFGEARRPSVPISLRLRY